MPFIGADQVATVYGRTGGTGPYNAVVKSGLACRLAHVNRQPGATSKERADLAAIRVLMWDPDYVMPDFAVVTVAGVTGQDGATVIRWNVNAATIATMRGPDGQPIYRRADLTKA